MYGLVFVVTVPPYVALSLYPPAVEYMLPEDAVYEMSQAMAYLAGGLLMTFTAVRAFRRLRPLGVLHAFVLVFAAALFFAGLEELDYGQRFLFFHTPEYWLDISMQTGVNLHNLHTGVSNRLMALIAITAGFVLPLLRLVWPWFAGLLARFRFPLPTGIFMVPFTVGAMYFIPADLRGSGGFDEQRLISWIMLAVLVGVLVYSLRTPRLRGSTRLLTVLLCLAVATKIVFAIYAPLWPREHLPYEMRETFNALGFLGFAWQIGKDVGASVEK
jgi:hypothetical protein